MTFRERARERNINVRARLWSAAPGGTPSTGDQAHHAGICPDTELNWWSFSAGDDAQNNLVAWDGQGAKPQGTSVIFKGYL